MPDIKEGLYVGLMSGTSVDGVDAALVDIRADSITSLGFAEAKYDDPLRTALLTLNSAPQFALADYIKLDHLVACAFANATMTLLANSKYSSQDIVAIGSHGQTISHLPQGTPPGTMQIGDPNVIATRTGIDTIADFRRADIARGGQGAPLAPAFHHKVFATDQPRIVLNLGGIANVTLLDGHGGQPSGFDTGPANTLLDAWTLKNTGKTYDENGHWARSGSIHLPLLHELCSDPYFSTAPPKSTGADYFNLEWLHQHLATLQADQLSPNVVQATLLELSVATIVTAIHTHHPLPAEVLLCGGGAHNGYLVDKLRAALGFNYIVRKTDDLGINSDFCEAIAFAWLAYRYKNCQPGNVPTVTGASGPAILGGLYRSTN